MKTLSAKQKQFFDTLPATWQKPLTTTCNRPEIDTLVQFLQERKSANATIYPSSNDILAALKTTPFDKVKVIIVGQDPYHGPGQAHGLSFSVPAGIKIPPSLRNIFKELHTDIGMPIPTNGTLTGWAQQGVLLLNALLTVEKGKPASHANKGWEFFTDAIIQVVLTRKQPVVLMLWGAYAQKKVQNLDLHIDPARDLVLKAAHPSPLSVTEFLGCKHFSQTNAFLKKHNLPEINWAQL